MNTNYAVTSGEDYRTPCGIADTEEESSLDYAGLEFAMNVAKKLRKEKAMRKSVTKQSQNNATEADEKSDYDEFSQSRFGEKDSVELLIKKLNTAKVNDNLHASTPKLVTQQIINYVSDSSDDYEHATQSENATENDYVNVCRFEQAYQETHEALHDAMYRIHPDDLDDDEYEQLYGQYEKRDQEQHSHDTSNRCNNRRDYDKNDDAEISDNEAENSSNQSGRYYDDETDCSCSSKNCYDETDYDADSESENDNDSFQLACDMRF